MNNSYYETLDKNFNNALKFFEGEYSHEELIEFLHSGNILQRQLAALQIKELKFEYDADTFMENLVGQDGKIREAVSFRLSEFLQNESFHPFFLKEKNYDIFLDAIIDINGNICRNTIFAISNLKKYPHFTNYFCPRLTNLTNNLISKVNEFSFSDGKYKVNKEVFKLYWCLETIYNFTSCVKSDILKEILLQTKSVGDYTIREKTAKILANIDCDSDLLVVRQSLKNDTNYYVKRF